MKQLVVVFLFSFTLFGCNKDFYQLLNDSMESSIKKRGKKIFVSGHDVRKSLIKKGFFSFIIENDTIYALEKYDYESATYYGSIWTDRKYFHYSYNKGIIEEKNKSPFNELLIPLISRWDTLKINKESSINYNQLRPNDYVVGYKSFKGKNGVNTIRIVFKPF